MQFNSQVAAVHTVLCSGELVTQAMVGRRLRLWHYTLKVQAPASAVAIAVGSFTCRNDDRPIPPLHQAAAEFMSSADDGSAGEAAALAGEDPIVTHFASPTCASLLESTLRPVRLTQALLEQWLTCRLPFPMFSQVWDRGRQ